jgi:outer membrane protein assembly factor BamA
MRSHPGLSYSTDAVTRDVQTLGGLGWFDDSVRVEAQPAATADCGLEEPKSCVSLIFYLQERPFLSGIGYTGSRILSRAQIDKLLTDRKLTPKLGEPENRAQLQTVANQIAEALRELAYPKAQVSILEEISTQQTAQARFVINDGPHLPLVRVEFTGNPVIPERELRAQMRHLQPGAVFAGLRGKNAYTREAFEQDCEHLLTYYRNHGYPEARIGEPTVRTSEGGALRRWHFPFSESSRNGLMLVVPVEAGPVYHIGRIQIGDALAHAVAASGGRMPSKTVLQPGMRYSDEAIDNLRRTWQTQIRLKPLRDHVATSEEQVEALRIRDPEDHTVHINLRLSDSGPYMVRRLQFEGLKRFPDRYLRKRILLEEGMPFDDRVLQAGLTRIVRTGYFKPIKKEDIHAQPNDLTHTVDVAIHVEELGVQRVSFVGGRAQFGNTVGLIYMLYNILDREELLSSRIEGGPEMLQVALSIAKEGFLGSRGTLALSVYNMVLRPRLISAPRGPYYIQQTHGITGDYSYAISNTDVLGINYGLLRSNTSYSLPFASAPTGLQAANVRANTSSHSVGLGWDRDTGSEHIILSDSVSGGLLGGTENLLRTKTEYGRIFHDRLFNSHNAWAFRTTFSAVGSYAGTTPVYALGLVGDQYVRGLKDGQLGPSAVVASTSSSGATTYSTAPAGANLITAANAEYRIPLAAHTEAATFFDLGSGRLLPNWFGPNPPTLLRGTNGILRASTGIELRWTVPGLGVPLRVYYALNVLRLDRPLTLPNGSPFKPGNRFAALGWGLGSFF